MQNQTCKACGRQNWNQIHGVWQCGFCGSTYFTDGEHEILKSRLTDRKTVSYYREADNYHRDGRYVLERTALGHALERAPDCAFTLFKIAESHRLSEEYQAAADNYREVLLRDPYHGEAYIMLGLVQCHRKRWQAAAWSLERGMTLIDPGHPNYWQYYAYSAIPYAHLDKRDKTLTMLKKANENGFTQDDAVRRLAGVSSPAGCYIATCVYGSYDCPQVWTLRRFRDNTLARTRYGRVFIRCYYAVSPKLVRLLGSTGWFRRMWKKPLDRMVAALRKKGVADMPYRDK